MTKEEKIIVSAYTGYLMCDFNELHEDVEKRLGRPVWSHEFRIPEVQTEIQVAYKEDFIKICEK